MRSLRIADIAFAAFCIISLLSACSSDAELDYPGVTDEDFISRLLDAKVQGTYVAVEYKVYDQPTGDTDWKEKDISNYYGWESILPSTFILDKGKSHVPFEFFHCASGPTVFSIPWGAYEKVYGNEGVFITYGFSYDSFKETVTIGAKTYDVISFNEKEIQLSFVSEYGWGESHNGGHHKEVMKYKRDDSPGIDGVKNHSFANSHEVYQFIIDKCREKFGDEFNVNAIYYPNLQFPRSILKLSDYENFLQFMKDHNTYDWRDRIFWEDMEISHEYNRLLKLCSMSIVED